MSEIDSNEHTNKFKNMHGGKDGIIFKYDYKTAHELKMPIDNFLDILKHNTHVLKIKTVEIPGFPDVYRIEAKIAFDDPIKMEEA